MNLSLNRGGKVLQTGFLAFNTNGNESKLEEFVVCNPVT
jgi:hypothetical protein